MRRIKLGPGKKGGTVIENKSRNMTLAINNKLSYILRRTEFVVDKSLLKKSLEKLFVKKKEKKSYKLPKLLHEM